MQIADNMGRTTPNPGRAAGAAVRLAAVLGIHVVVLFILIQLDPEVRKRIEPVLVSLITPQQPPEPEPAPLPPQAAPKVPLKLAPKVPPLPPAVTAPDPPPAAVAAPNAIMAPAPPVATAPAEAGSAASAPTPAAEVAKPALLVPPRFDAAYLNNPRPEYPRAARRLGEHGKVMLQVFVAATGTPEKIVVHASSGSPRLDQAAREAVERWKFVPARQGDEPVSAWVLVPITFVLEG